MHFAPTSSMFSALAAVIFLTACQPAEAPSVATPMVMVQAAALASAPDNAYNGEIRARHEFDLAFRVAGKMAARLVDVGAEITPGQPLARLDPVDLELSAGAARAQLAAAESDFATARAERDRYADLLKKKFVSATAFEAKENAFNSASGRLAQARAQATLSGNQAAYGVLTSDQPAIVTAILADAGQVLSAGQAVMRLARPEAKEVAIAVPENRLAALQSAPNMTVNLWAAPEISLQGRLREVAPAADAATRTFLVRIALIDPPPEVRLGMSARVVLGTKTGALIQVPLNAVVNQGQGAQVWLVEDGKAITRSVEVDAFRENGAMIAKGLREGEQVIISGLNQLVPGLAVTPRPVTLPERQR